MYEHWISNITQFLAPARSGGLPSAGFFLDSLLIFSSSLSRSDVCFYFMTKAWRDIFPGPPEFSFLCLHASLPPM